MRIFQWKNQILESKTAARRRLGRALCRTWPHRASVLAQERFILTFSFLFLFVLHLHVTRASIRDWLITWIFTFFKNSLPFKTTVLDIFKFWISDFWEVQTLNFRVIPRWFHFPEGDSLLPVESNRENIQNLKDKRTFECVTCGHKYIKAQLSANNKTNYIFLAGFLSSRKRHFWEEFSKFSEIQLLLASNESV